MGQESDQDREIHHRSDATCVACGVLTVSDTRTIDTDRGGALLVELLEGAGHRAAVRQIVRDERGEIESVVSPLVNDVAIDAVLITGGTGISQRDQTFETISRLLTKPLPGYGELFRMLSFEEIGAAAMLSRAVGGLIDQTVVLTMPGSTAAVRLAMQRLILPQLGHLVREATK